MEQTKGKLKKIIATCTAALMLTALVPTTACVQTPKLSFLKTQGEQVVNEEGETVYLRGVNAGGIGVIEQWMNGFARSSSKDSDIICRDHKTTSQVFIERFGMKEAQNLWETYQAYWWSDEDFENCVDMGINVIRLPFTYMNVDFDAVLSYDNAGNYDFSFLDDFINRAASYGIYTILDLHGAYGSQNGKDHSGEVVNAENVDFYSNQKMQQLTIDLWKALANHYKNNSNVAAYDILNEPAEGTASGGTLTTTTRHWEFFDKVYDAIREIDTEHIVVFESCWEGYHLPQPSAYGWENCMYSFHHYTGTTDFYTNMTSWLSKITEIESNKFGVPLYMGEFTCYENEESWRYCLNLMNERGWHWTSWTYKINNTWGNSAWGIVRIETSNYEKVNAHTDSLEDIKIKFANLLTDEDIQYCSFESGVLLYEIFQQYLIVDEPVEEE